MYLQNISQDFLLEVKPQKRVPNFCNHIQFKIVMSFTDIE